MILNTKLQVPFIRTVLVQRPTLMKRLHEGMHVKLTMIVAPAGYGKSTLLRDWVKQCDTQVAWLSLDKQENDFGRFWSYVIAAIEKTKPGFGASVKPILSNIQPEYYEPMITVLLDEFADLKDSFVLIIDDFHVIELSPINDSLAYLLEYLPPHIHLFISSRSHPTLPTARLEVIGELHKIMIQDLRFHLDEGIHFFQKCMDLSLSKEETSLLVSHTEGWISGLQMAGISLKLSSDPTDFIHKFSGQQRNISNYLLEEVFSRQPERVRTFLLQTSILSRMNSGLCQAVTGFSDCQDQLEMLEQRQLFVIALDEHKEWHRYHHLFSEFLQQQLWQKYPELWEQSHALAAKWLESQGFVDEAVDHYLAGRHFADAVRLIENLLPALVHLKRSAVNKWLNNLPEDFIAGNPTLEIFRIGGLFINGEWQQVKSRILLIQDKLSEDPWKPHEGTVYLVGATIAYIQKDWRQNSEYLEKFDNHTPEGSYMQMIGGNTAQGTDYDNMLAYINDLHEANSYVQHWIKALENKIHYPFIGYYFVSYSELMYEWNRLEEAELYAERALERKDFQPFSRILVRASMHLSQVQQARGRLDQAFEFAQKAKLKVNSPDSKVFIEKIEAHKIHLSLLQEEYSNVASWLQSCGLKHTDGIPVSHISEFLTFARALEHCEQADKALYVMERLYRLVSKEDRVRDKIKVLIVHSMMLYKQGNMDDAMRKLADALRMAEPQGYIRSFVDEGERMAELLSHYLRLRQIRFIHSSKAASLLYIKKLLQMLNIAVGGSSSYSVTLTDQEMRILRLIEKGFTNKQMAEQCFVTAETVKTHIKHIYMKLDVNTRLQVIERAKELRLL